MNTYTIADVIADALVSPAFGMSADMANMLATGIINTAARRGYAGMDFRLPSLRNMTIKERNELIRKDFTGKNLQEVIKKYGVSKTTVYRACHQ